MKVQENGSVVMSKQEWEYYEHLVSEMMNMVDKARGDFMMSDDISEIESFLDN